MNFPTLFIMYYLFLYIFSSIAPFFLLLIAAVLGGRFADANNDNIDKVVGSWLIHCKYKKGAKKDVCEDSEEQSADVNITETIDPLINE